MLNKKVLLGSLVAGAMLLPMTANSGVVTGACVNCHTMHQTDGLGGARAGGPTLLEGNSCEGCHATGNGNDAGGTGTYDNGNFAAPQVDDPVRPNLAGFFDTSGTQDENNMHNTTDIAAVNAETTNTPFSPGGSSADTSCGGCHALAAGGHHGAAGTAYRMLFDTTGTDQTSDADYGNSDGAMPDVNGTTYDSDAMNGVCVNCHGGFHEIGTGATPNSQRAAGAWIRHPTDIDIADAVTNAMAGYNYATNYGAVNRDEIPLGTSSSVQAGFNTGSQTIMCITCHFAHGYSNANMIRFAYDNGSAGDNVAGDDVASVGCETCHNYGGTPQNGM